MPNSSTWSAAGLPQRMGATYRGRFAPSPTGPLHAGSLLAALASWLDARAHHGVWLVRIEDVDTPRCVPGADLFILQQLAVCGLLPDEAPLWQSTRQARYRETLDHLVSCGMAYPCACSRKDIALAMASQGSGKARHGELVYPGTCRHGLDGRTGRAWRLRTDRAEAAHRAGRPSAASAEQAWHWVDRRLGVQSQHLSEEVGDFVLLRADGLWAYQLAVVVDDADQGITHIVRGEDLADNTVRQLALQAVLGSAPIRYLHTPLVMGLNGEKLSKQNGAAALDLSDPLATLNQAAAALGLTAQVGPVSDALAGWATEWHGRFGLDK